MAMIRIYNTRIHPFIHFFKRALTMKLLITPIMFVLGISISSAQLNISNVSTTVFSQIDWQGNKVWKDEEGAIILKERKYDLLGGTRIVRIVSGLNRRNTALMNSELRYILNAQGNVVVIDLDGNRLGKYINGPDNSLVFQYNPRLFRWALPVGYEYSVI